MLYSVAALESQAVLQEVPAQEQVQLLLRVLTSMVRKVAVC